MAMIERLSPTDLPECLALARDRQWPAEERKWRLLLELGTGFGIRDELGQLIGTTIVTCYRRELAVISMVLVARAHGGRGLGRQLVARALAEAGAGAVALNATESGRPLYEKFGFAAVSRTHTYLAPGVGRPVLASSRTRTASLADLAELTTLDAAVHGADRARLVARLPGFTEHLRVLTRAGAITGYAGAWSHPEATVIGPVIAETVADAKALIAEVAREVTGPVRLDLDGRHLELREWVTRWGAEPRNTVPVMLRGAPDLPGDRSRWFAPVMQALG